MAKNANTLTYLGSGRHVDFRAKDQQLFNYVAFTLVIMDLVYFVTIFITSLNPWLSVGLAVLLPLLNVSAVKMSSKTERTLIAYTLPLSLIPMFFVTYVSGVNSPAWLMTFGVITATNIIYPIEKLRAPLICALIGCALLGTWFAGANLLHLLIIAITLLTVSAVLNRIFSYLEIQKYLLRNEIIDREEKEDALKLSEARYQALVEEQTEVITRFTPDGKFIFANEAYAHFVGKKPADLIGASIFNDVPKDKIPSLAKYFKSFSQKRPRLTIENSISNAAGELRYFEWSNSATFDEHGNITEILSVGRDITERKQAEAALQESEQLLHQQVVELTYKEEQLEAQAADLVRLAEDLDAAKHEMQQLANHDALTGLPSLRLCKDRLEIALATDRRNKSQTAVLFVDLDGFKAVNDSMGHEAGDEVLRGVAERLKSSIRERDTAARIGGDEFILILPETGDKDATAKVAQKVIDEISKPFSVDGGIARIGASIGIAISPADGTTSDELLRHADESMYRIKKQGKNNYGFFA